MTSWLVIYDGRGRWTNSKELDFEAVEKCRKKKIRLSNLQLQLKTKDTTTSI